MAEATPKRRVANEPAKRGYQGLEDPGAPTSLMQTQTKPIGQDAGAAQGSGSTLADPAATASPAPAQDNTGD